MLITLKRSRETVIKNIWLKACDNKLTIDQAQRLVIAFDQEYELARDSIERYQRACFQLTENRTIILEPAEGR